ncbi:MAG TPA: DUF4056 domain-containing protein [Sedimentisphaerales bacterium]|jgi:hypothetical protein|nr:DUF4056 domain-containing protein [Sedimentisphaerales bacterium]HNU28850.1 DUF4056 domain-containing protein [Sedimentisphaerales bacterium]
MRKRRASLRLPLAGLLLLALAGTGCRIIPDKGLAVPADELVLHGLNFAPRIRYGAYPTSILGTPWASPKLGNHGYYWRLSEKNGIACTCRAGHVDIMHVRIAADWTAYLAGESYRHILRGDKTFSYKLLVDRSKNHVVLSYPENWRSLPQEERRRIAREVALAMGPYLAFTMVTWHEIITWYGFQCIGLPTEYASAFSWEDSYSNLLGTILAARALRDSEHSYDQALKIVLDDQMKTLGVLPAKVSKQASESVYGDWYKGRVSMFVDLRRRNFDIGLDDGYITPTLLPNLAGCESARPISYPSPTLDALSRYGFSAHVEIQPREWEKNRVLRIVYPDKKGKRIFPAEHFPIIMAQIRREAEAKYGPEMVADPQP